MVLHCSATGTCVGKFLFCVRDQDERLLAVGYANQRIELFDVASGALLQRWDPGTRHRMRPTGAAILEVAFAENQGYLFALTGDGRLLELRRS